MECVSISDETGRMVCHNLVIHGVEFSRSADKKLDQMLS